MALPSEEESKAKASLSSTKGTMRKSMCVFSTTLRKAAEIQEQIERLESERDQILERATATK
jgi:hypothetical protein